MLDNWLLSQNNADPLQQLAQSLNQFCLTNAPPLDNQQVPMADQHAKLSKMLSAESIKSFLQDYRHYHSHWPLLHLATFNPFTAHHALVLAMCSIGAVYSDSLDSADLNWFVEYVRGCVHTSSEAYRTMQNPQASLSPTSRISASTEELQALVLLHSLFLWHGPRAQRQKGREAYPGIARLVRETGHLQPLPMNNPDASALHQPGPITGDEGSSWRWETWIENEKRSRLMAFTFMMDACLVIFFNNQPQFDVYDVRVPLPADDAAWETTSSEECASALGLRGEAAQFKNDSGSRRAKQLGLSEVLQVLYGTGHGSLPERATNAFGKFIVIHAIHVQIYNIQRQLLRRASGSGTSTPQSLTDSPVVQPGGVNEQTQHLLRATVRALELWKSTWDTDLTIQFAQNQHRKGYCRDGVHYYFLAQLFIRKSRPEDWAAPADLRCRNVFNLLKHIRAHVASDSIQKGIEMGSITTIADDFAIGDLTLHMRRLFTPLENA
jgi:hypothetical protein